ncbi:MAG TPA: hypothetical protein VGV69_06140 [Solirubrobacterales bacterium]|nr:hypothetical protein [Solirubrobacterales bacterium]
MKARGFLAILACAVAALAALPAAAAAEPGYVVKEKSLNLGLALPADNGYFATLQTEGHRKVTLTVEKGFFSASYTALGRVSRKGIEADFGELGQVSLRFRGKSRFRGDGSSSRSECRGRAPVRERGIFHGNVRLSGERGYVKVRGNRLRGVAVRTYRRTCKLDPKASASKADERFEIVSVEALAKRFGETRLFVLTEGSFPDGKERTAQLLVAGAGQKKKVGRVAVFKLLLLFLTEGYDALEITPRSADPLVAEVKMRKPFAGTGTYLEEGKLPPTWSGDFGIRLPGSGLVPLAGPEFEVQLCRSSTGREILACADRPSLNAQGSGSHSQPLALARLSSLR